MQQAKEHFFQLLPMIFSFLQSRQLFVAMRLVCKDWSKSNPSSWIIGPQKQNRYYCLENANAAILHGHIKHLNFQMDSAFFMQPQIPPCWNQLISLTLSNKVTNMITLSLGTMKCCKSLSICCTYVLAFPPNLKRLKMKEVICISPLPNSVISLQCQYPHYLGTNVKRLTLLNTYAQYVFLSGNYIYNLLFLEIFTLKFDSPNLLLCENLQHLKLYSADSTTDCFQLPTQLTSLQCKLDDLHHLLRFPKLTSFVLVSTDHTRDLGWLKQIHSCLKTIDTLSVVEKPKWSW